MTYDQIVKRLITLAGLAFNRGYEYYRKVFPRDHTDYASYEGSKDKLLGRLYWHWLKDLVVENIISDVQFLYEHSRYEPFTIEHKNKLKAQLDSILPEYMQKLESQIPPFLVDEKHAKEKEKKERRKTRASTHRSKEVKN